MRAYKTPPLRAGYNRTADQVRRQYIEWAYAAGLKHVHAWKGTLGYHASLKSVELGAGLQCTFLDPDTFGQVQRSAEPARAPRLVAAAAVACALAGCSTLMGPAPRAVQDLNDGLEVVFQVAHVADTIQTYHGPASDKCYEEGDQLTRRIIGATPTRNQVIGWGVGYAALHYGVTKWLNSTGHDYLATGWELLTIEGTGNALAKGFRVGVRIGAPNKDTGCRYDGGNARP